MSSVTSSMYVVCPVRSVPINTDNVKLILTKHDDMREHAYINVSGAAINSNKLAGCFGVNAAQYTTYYKSNRALSFLPVQAHFNSNKYKMKKPIPSNNTYVSVEGFLDAIGTDSNGNVTTFHVSVDNINFLGKSTVSSATSSTAGILTSKSYIYQLLSYLQLHPQRLGRRASNSILIHPLLTQLRMPHYPIPLHNPTLGCQREGESVRNKFSVSLLYKS